MSARLSIDTTGWRFAKEATYACLLCYDSGKVVIWHPDTIKRAMAHPDANVVISRFGVKLDGWITCMCRCSCGCEVGDGQWKNRRKRVLAIYGSRPWHIRVGRSDDEIREAKVEAANYEAIPHYTEFEAFQ